MKGYLSIGKVSKLKNISIKSLRYYDEIGVLKPSYTNPSTGYRYYTQDQLFLLDAIILCLELGIPLKDLSKYVEEDHINLQNLLYDGKVLAEEKIKTLRNCLSELNTCLEAYEHGPVKMPVSVYYDRKIEERSILTLPLDEEWTDAAIQQKIIQLFMLAQSMQLHPAYPSGILYDYEEDSVSKSIFISIMESPDAHPLLRALPKGYYLCHQHPTRMIVQGKQLFASFLEGKKNFCLIETDLWNESQRHDTNNTFEIQLFMSTNRRKNTIS